MNVMRENENDSAHDIELERLTGIENFMRN